MEKDKQDFLLEYLKKVKTAFALPFIGVIGFFTHPENPIFGYFFLITVAALDIMIGGTMLGLITMAATALAGQVAAFIYPQVGIADILGHDRHFCNSYIYILRHFGC